MRDELLEETLLSVTRHDGSTLHSRVELLNSNLRMSKASEILITQDPRPLNNLSTASETLRKAGSSPTQLDHQQDPSWLRVPSNTLNFNRKPSKATSGHGATGRTECLAILTTTL